MRGIQKTGLGILATALLIAAAALAPAAQATPSAAWSLTLAPMPSNFDPASALQPEYLVTATNVGAAPTSGTSTLTLTLPDGLTPAQANFRELPDTTEIPCTISSQTVTCAATEAIQPGALILAEVKVALSAAKGVYDTQAKIEGGGAAKAVKATSPTPVQGEAVPFGFLSGFQSPLTGQAGEALSLAGSHPYQQTVSFNFPTRASGNELTNDGHPRDIWTELPRGLVGDPAATQGLCTEAELELEGEGGCPLSSQVGIAGITTALGRGTNGILISPIYNMVPPAGTVAELGFDAGSLGFYAHLFADVRSDSDYGIQATAADLLGFGTIPIFGVQAQLWGDPAADEHEPGRECKARPCLIEEKEKTGLAFLTLPGDCPAAAPSFQVLADSWEEPFPEFERQSASYEGADLSGTPVSTTGCGDEEVAFKPTIEAKPSTNATDSPAGIDFTLRQPQNMKLDKRSPSPLRDAKITFPAAMTVNPAQAAGLGACGEDQIGFEEETEAGRLDFSKQPQSCPDAAKIGSLEASTPALVARNEKHEVEEDVEGEAVLEALHGSVYLAKPFANPFGSLVAIYLVVEDEKTGLIAKLAGKGELDPNTGRLTTYVRENPELPLQDVRVHTFDGSRGALITPPTCGKYTTESQLVPWAAPEAQAAFPAASFQMTRAPGGGPCPSTEAQMPNAFKLNAGSQSAAAGKYSPLLFKLSREDGSQRLSRIESTLPRGVIAKLAGIGTCSEADIAKARSREAPEKGAAEQADPSCPASSRVGSIIAGAGAGPTPFYTAGNAYLAGPYKGAPVSIVAIVPAVAGPFDLGTVVSRIAIYIDPVSAEVRAVSDPLPRILDGVPVDLRSVALRADRPNFSLNPTSCAVKSFGGQTISTLGQAAPLFERFQVGGCKSLHFKPKMQVRLFGKVHRGAHPRLRAVLTAKPGGANIAKASFTFPRSEFIDQAHFRTICTRVQFAAKQCPAGSIYGHVKVLSPLVDYPLEGPAYLRSSSHELPDLVVALHGPPSQPIEIDADGRVDSVNGGLRVRFGGIPDAPVSKLIFSAQGAKKGLFQNSTNICKGTHRATLKLDAQSGKISDSRPKLLPQCAKKGKRSKKPKKAKRGGHR